MARRKASSTIEERPEQDAIKIKYREALDLAHELTATDKQRFRTARLDDRNYRPFMLDGKPNDLVGRVLYHLGVDVPRRYNVSSVTRLRRVGLIDCNDKTLQLLQIMQDGQDDGKPFGPSLWLAECVIATNKLPWEKGKEIE